MANTNFDRGHLLIGKRLVHIFGSFQLLAGSGTVVASSVKGLGFGYAPNLQGVMALKAGPRPGITSTPGITYVSAGTYDITLEDSYIDAIDYEAHLIYPSGGTLTNAARMYTSPTNLGVGGLAPTFRVATIVTGGTLTDLGTTFRLGFHIWLRDSTVQFVKP